MPKRIEKAKIALIDASLEIEKTELDAKINIESPDQIEAFLKQEETMLKDMADKILASGANVVVCQKGIDDMAQHFLARKGVIAIRRAKKSDMEKLAKATGGKIVSKHRRYFAIRPWICSFGGRTQNRRRQNDFH